MMSRAVHFNGPEAQLEIAEVAAPPLREGEILVRVLACTLCRSDLHTHAGRRHGPTPSILGHEIVGRIEAFGPGASTLDVARKPAAVGDRITWSIVVGCGDCFFCERDLPQKCVRLYKYGHEAVTVSQPLGGGLADHVVLVPNTAWLLLPSSIPTSVAALANCAGATAASALRAAGSLAGQRDLQSAVDFLAGPGGRFPFESLIVENYPLAQVETAFRSAHAHPGERVCVNC